MPACLWSYSFRLMFSPIWIFWSYHTVKKESHKNVINVFWNINVLARLIINIHSSVQYSSDRGKQIKHQCFINEKALYVCWISDKQLVCNQAAWLVSYSISFELLDGWMLNDINYGLPINMINEKVLYLNEQQHIRTGVFCHIRSGVLSSRLVWRCSFHLQSTLVQITKLW